MKPNLTPKKLDTTNPDHLHYENGMLSIAILGGIRLEGLDRLRVTLKTQVTESGQKVGVALRHNLDLYNDTQVEKLVRKLAEKLEIGTSVGAAALMELTDLLESHRLKEIEAQKTGHEKKKMLTKEEMAEAVGYLSAPNLMGRTNTDIGRAGVVGEEVNRLLMYLIFTSRKQPHPLHVVSLGSSGAGKTHLQEKVGGLIPEEDKIEITTLSENAFYYFGQRQLKNKLILIEDLDGAEGVLYPLRELQSKKKISKTVVHKNTKGETRTVHLSVEGPVSVAGCTTRESLYEDNANRSFLVHIDESVEQDKRVMDHQRKLSAGKVDLTEERNVRERFRNMQRALLPVTVRNPYAEKLLIPEEVFKPRRTNAHYLAFIEAVTFYHQYQRKKEVDRDSGEEYIETTLEDIAEANRLLKEVLLRKSDMLSGPCRNYFERLKSWLIDTGETGFTNVAARHALKIKHSTQKNHMAVLQSWGLVGRSKGDKKNGYRYEVGDYGDYEKKLTGIGNVLDGILSGLAKEAQEAQKKSCTVKGPLNGGKTPNNTENGRSPKGTQKRHTERKK